MLETSLVTPELSVPPATRSRKLIEVALPLQAINKASAREKLIRHQHPSTLHLWWSRKPLAATRAVLFASLVDDPSSHPEVFPTLMDQERERKRLFNLIEQMVQWENLLDPRVLAQAQAEIRQSIRDELPTVYDPFCGGGSIALEAHRLGLPTFASDLNPVAVLITKAATEIPRRFAGYNPVHLSLRGLLSTRSWEGASGLAADVQEYGNWMFAEARERLERFYPKITSRAGNQLTVIAWLWARTVRCANPLCGADMPLINSFALSTKSSKEWSIEPVVNYAEKTVRFRTRPGKPIGGGTIDRRGARCIVCNEPVSLAYIRAEGKAKRFGLQMIAVAAEGPRGRTYLPPDDDHDKIARSATPAWAPDTDLAYNPRHMSPPLYGMTQQRDLFTSRQLLALSTFSDLVRECRVKVLSDAIAAGMADDGVSLEASGTQATAYADAVATYLAFALDRFADYWSTLNAWQPQNQQFSHTFARQALSMTWGFAEANPFSGKGGSFANLFAWTIQSISQLGIGAAAEVFQGDAASLRPVTSAVISTDPPYYDNVPYADLSDYFYIWLRSAIGSRYPDLFASLLVPKAQELIADRTRFNDDRERARSFFENGLGEAFRAVRAAAGTMVPTTIYYAFKQSESDFALEKNGDGLARSSVGWESMLNALLSADFEIVGTWPLSSELPNRARGQKSNALASSIVLVCRPRLAVDSRCTRPEFLMKLREELPEAVRALRNASLAATDLEQAAIGPGMSVFSRYREVLEQDGNRMSVRSALAMINQELTAIVLGEIGDVDAETHFALAWFDGHFYDAAKYGEAEVLLKAKNATLNTLRDSGVVRADGGVLRIIRPSELKAGQFVTLSRADSARSIPAWAQLIFLTAALTSEDGGTEAAADALRAIGVESGERLKDLAYHCYLACDRAKRSVEAQDFNALVTAWPDLQKLARERDAEPTEARLL